jgi:osmotically-inducible protein OsmY
MGNGAGIWTACAVSGLALLAGGCSGEDSDGLTRVCAKATERGEDLTGGRQSKLATSWQALRGSAGNSAIDSRVSIRLRWDKTLADADLRITTPSSGVVRLEGTITSPAQRGRAIELAQTTQGVTEVVDALEFRTNGE